MAKKKRKQNFRPFQCSNGGGFFTTIFTELYDSKAFGELTANEERLYFRMYRKLKIVHGENGLVETNENNISMPRSEYEKLMTQRSFEKSMDSLIELGFIKVIRMGYGTRECNIYGFNNMWQKYGTSGFDIKHEWRRYKKPKEVSKLKEIV